MNIYENKHYENICQLEIMCKKKNKYNITDSDNLIYLII